ncbi:MAG: LacI family DNA-binding transcriptional regulator [Clostridiales bacterium]|nr:LacI family DNA-binding transcriptional regulator [Clostridiales bacterium]
MRVTAKELARRLNLSETAVSMALNNKAGVSRETKERVIKEAEKLGYDFSRLSMKKNHAGMIYCIIWRAHNAILNYTPIFSELTDGITEECRKHEYRLRTIQIYEKTNDFQRTMEDLRLSDCAGIILLGTEITAEICREFLTLSVPIVLLDTYFEALECSSVLINNTQGAYLATDYLIDRTQSQPGYLKSSYRIENFEERSTGFIKAVHEHGMSTAKSIRHELAPSIDGAFSDMLEIIDRGDDIARCYFADNDLIAIGAIRAFKLRGYKIPDDVAIIGFDNISEDKIVEPSLTTIDIPRKFMGQTAVKQLLEQIANPVSHTVKVEVATRLIKRFSA